VGLAGGGRGDGTKIILGIAKAKAETQQRKSHGNLEKAIIPFKPFVKKHKS
jgi:hypothetical protein